MEQPPPTGKPLEQRPLDGTGAVDPSLIGATSSAAPAGYAGTDRFQPSGTDRNSSGGGNSTAGAIGAGGAHYYLSGGKKIAVQTTGVIHKTIKIPKKVPKNGKLLFFVLCNMALIFFCIKIFLFYYFFLVKLVVAKMIVSYNHHPHFIALSARDTAIKSVSILFGQRACPASTSTTATLMSCIIMKYQIRT